MPIFKISNKLQNFDDNSIKVGYPSLNSNGKCKACEMPSTEENPIISLGTTEDGKHEILSHAGCAPAEVRKLEVIDLNSRRDRADDDNIWSFTNKLRSVASTTPDNSTVQETFPTENKGEQKVEDMTKKQVDANYDSSGTPVPPKN